MNKLSNLNAKEKANNNVYLKYCVEKISNFNEKVTQNKYAKYVDVKFEVYSGYLETRIAPFATLRWLFALGLVSLFSYRIYEIHGFYILAHGLYSHLLVLYNHYNFPKSQLKEEIPKDLESQNQKVFSSETELLLNTNEEVIKSDFTEFQFWRNVVISALVYYSLTFWDIFNIPINLSIIVPSSGALTLFILLRHIKCLTHAHRFIIILFLGTAVVITWLSVIGRY